MGELLKGQSKDGSTESDPGTQGGSGAHPKATESDIVKASEQGVAGHARKTGFNPDQK